jgi:aminoglycoside phosphotransferase (APT) family kinase protein
MHADELHTDISLVARLLAAQFPEWADLPIERVPSSGTDNALYRLGDELVVRLPRIEWATGQVEKDSTWLPRLAPLLPLAIPELLAPGVPAEGYPWTWGVYRWLPGENPDVDAITDPEMLARDVGRFVVAVRSLSLEGARPALAPRRLRHVTKPPAPPSESSKGPWTPRRSPPSGRRRSSCPAGRGRRCGRMAISCGATCFSPTAG